MSNGYPKKIAMKIFNKISRYLKAKKTNQYWVQQIPCHLLQDRWDVISKYCFGKNVIHFGCTDYPVFNPRNNLHLKLARICNTLHGFDVDTAGLKLLHYYYPSKYYNDYAELASNKYDVCLVPETIEHVDNIKTFLENIERVDASIYIFTAPNCFHSKNIKRFWMDKNIFYEVVHPDHNAWFSPYTLKNVIEKYSQIKITKCYLTNENSIIVCVGENDK